MSSSTSASSPGKTLYLENRLNQLNGQGPVAVDSQLAAQNSSTTECSAVLNSSQPAIKPAGTGDLLSAVPGERHGCDRRQRRSCDQSLVLQPAHHERGTPHRAHLQVRSLERPVVDQRPVHGLHTSSASRSSRTASEQWLLTNLTGDWTHPVHIHLEEHQILSRNRVAPTVPADTGRKDVTATASQRARAVVLPLPRLGRQVPHPLSQRGA